MVAQGGIDLGRDDPGRDFQRHISGACAEAGAGRPDGAAGERGNRVAGIPGAGLPHDARYVVDETDGRLLEVGIAWLAATIVFEFGFGHFVDGKGWGELLHDYNIFAGRLWPVFLGLSARAAAREAVHAAAGDGYWARAATAWSAGAGGALMLTAMPKRSAVRRATAPIEGRILVGAQQVVDTWFQADNRGPFCRAVTRAIERQWPGIGTDDPRRLAFIAGGRGDPAWVADMPLRTGAAGPNHPEDALPNVADPDRVAGRAGALARVRPAPFPGVMVRSRAVPAAMKARPDLDHGAVPAESLAADRRGADAALGFGAGPTERLLHVARAIRASQYRR